MMSTSNDGLGLLLSSAVAGTGFAAYQTILRWRRFLRREREFAETKQALINNLSASQIELDRARDELAARVHDINTLTTQLQVARGEMGTQLSERVILGRDLQHLQRQLDETRHQLDRTKLEMRSKQLGETWEDDY